MEDHLRLTEEAITKRNFLPYVFFQYITLYWEANTRIRHFREARKEAYTVKNIKSAFKCTCIVPFNPCRVLGQYSGTAAADPKTPSAPTQKVPAPSTPANNRAVRHLHHEVKECLKAIDDPVLEILVNKLANAAIRGLTKGYLQEDRAA